jgi:hypothetical protein
MDEAQHKSTSRLAAVLAGSLLCALLATALQPARAQDAAQPAAADATLAQYARVGVVPLRDEGNVHDGAALLTAMLAGRLGARFDQVEFVAVDPAEAGLGNEPLLLNEAKQLGAHYQVEALLDGVFLGVEIVGGTWPNIGSDLPMARGMLRWRLVDCRTGLLALDGKVAPKKAKFYPKAVRTEEDLVSRVMQDMVAQVGDDLEAAGLLAGTEPPMPPETDPESDDGVDE